MSHETTRASFWLMFIRLLEAHGVEPVAFLREIGIDPATLREPGKRLPVRMVDLTFVKAAEHIADPAFGLRAAQCWHPSHLDALGYAWLSSTTLHRGFDRLARYSRIVGDRFGYRVVEEARGLRVIFDHGRGDEAFGHALTDFNFSIVVDMCRRNYPRQLNPSRILLRRPLPADPQPYREFYACEVHFGADEDALVLAAADAEALLATANQQIAAACDAILAEQLAALTDDDLVSRCETFLLKHLSSGEPTVDDLVKAFGMSRRSLQRKLEQRQTSFQQLLERTRYALAKRYLRDPDKSVTEVTFLLGFSEQSAFTRAFKRWSGAAPRDYRAALSTSLGRIED